MFDASFQMTGFTISKLLKYVCVQCSYVQKDENNTNSIDAYSFFLDSKKFIYFDLKINKFIYWDQTDTENLFDSAKIISSGHGVDGRPVFNFKS